VKSGKQMRQIERYNFVIEGRLESLNDYINACRANRNMGAELKRNTQRLLEFIIKTQLRGVEIDRPVVIKYRWFEKSRKRDLDNISSFGRKVIQDALVTSRVLKDDGWDSIIGFTDQFFIDKNNPRIEVEIEVIK